ncbi:MAG: hypothetical protein ACI308_03100 [Muribaculaceae bacterium]
MLSKTMRFRRLALSVALLAVILVVLKLIQPSDADAIKKPEPVTQAVEKCDVPRSGKCQCDSCRCCRACRCGN